MTHIHYKFSSKLSYDTVVFDGPHITLSDLKKQIMGREKLRAMDCDLQITNAQTKQEYTDVEGLISKGSSVIVRRIPVSGVKSSSSSKTHNIDRSDVHLHRAFGASRAMDDQNSTKALSFFSKMQMANLVDADVSEEDKIKVIMNQSSYDSMNLSKKLSTSLPGNYTCYRCGNTGHHIRNCPASGQDKNVEAPLRIKKSTGIPRSFMVEVDDPSIKGAMLTSCGRYAIPAIDAEAYAIGKKERPPFIPQEQSKSESEEDPIPDELLCLICRDLLCDAVVIPCCGNSYCDDCIRTTLLDSEDHVCPTCSQSDVSPDTLIANKFLRQAVNNFKKERGYTKTSTRVATTQSQNSNLTPNPVPTPPLLTLQSQPQKPQQCPTSQQNSVLDDPKAANTASPPQVPGVLSAAAGPASAHNLPSTSLQPVQSHLEILDLNETEGKTHSDSASASPSLLVSGKDPTAAPSQLIPLVSHSPVAEVNVSKPLSSSDSAPRQSGSSVCRDSFSSSSGCPTGGWKESNTQRLALSSSSSSSSSYSVTPPPLFPRSVFHSFLPAPQTHNSYPPGYPPGYPPATSAWTLPTPQGSPIPSLCSSTSTSSIPVLIPKEWYRYQRKKKERSPHRGSSYRHSSAHSNSKSSKSKSSHSYSSSHSGSRSRSRSQGKSRPRSYSHRRDHHSHSRPSCSYSYGYKRSHSPTASSSSSPPGGYQSSSKLPTDPRKNNHHSRHHSKKSSSSSYSSRKRGERSGREAGSSVGSLPRSLHIIQRSTQELELDRERYLQWKEYTEWCQKYFSSYVSQFHQLPPPPPLLSLAPAPCPQWENRGGRRNPSHAFDSRSQPQTRRTTERDGKSPSSESSSYSRSPPSQSSSDSHRTLSRSSSDSCSSLSRKANDSCSPPSQSSSDDRSTPSEDRAQEREDPESYTEKYSHLPLTHTKNSEDVNLQERNTDDKQQMRKILADFCPLRHEPKSIKKQEEQRGEEPSSHDAADSADGNRKDKRKDNSRTSTCEYDPPIQDKASPSDASESAQPVLKPDKPVDKTYERRVKEERNLEREKGWRISKDSLSRQDMDREHKIKPRKESHWLDTDREESLGGSKAPDSRSPKNRKRKGEDLERNDRETSLAVKPQNSKYLKTKMAKHPDTSNSEPPTPFDKKKPKTEKKMERKPWSLTKTDIWEGGMHVKPQKKISININLDSKREEKTHQQDLSFLVSIMGKSQETTEHTGITEEEKLNKDTVGTEVNVKSESSRDQNILFEKEMKPNEAEARQIQDKTFSRDTNEGIWEKTRVVDEDEGGEDDLNLWHCALRGVEEVKESVTGKEEEAERVSDDHGEMRELALISQEMGADIRGEPQREELGDRRECEEPDTMRSSSQRSKDKSSHDGPHQLDDGSGISSMCSCEAEESQEGTVVKTLEEYSQDREADGQEKLILIQVPRSKWEKEEDKVQEKEEDRVNSDRVSILPITVPHPSVTPTSRETEGDNDQLRRTSMETETHRDRVRVTKEEREERRNYTLSKSRTSVSPSSERDRTYSTLCKPRERMTVDREREREKERQKERKRSKEHKREKERRMRKEREHECSSSASAQKRNFPSSSSHSNSVSTSQYRERTDRHQGGSSKSSSCLHGKLSSGRSRGSNVMSRASDLMDKNAHRTYRDMSLDFKWKDKHHSDYYNNHQDPSRNY